MLVTLGVERVKFRLLVLLCEISQLYCCIFMHQDNIVLLKLDVQIIIWLALEQDLLV